jgi:hypothetical protein
MQFVLTKDNNERFAAAANLFFSLKSSNFPKNVKILIL